MLTEKDVRQALRETVKSDVVDSWNADYNFLEGDLDSLDHVTFALFLDESYGLKIRDEELPALNTIQAVLDFAEKKANM